MTTFAQVKSGTVINVIVAEQDFIDTIPPEENIEWIKTEPSNYAYMGGIYEKSSGVFCPPKPGIDWTLDSNNEWQPPIPFPDTHDDTLDLVDYYWDDTLYQKDKTQGWVFTLSDPLPLTDNFH